MCSIVQQIILHLYRYGGGDNAYFRNLIEFVYVAESEWSVSTEDIDLASTLCTLCFYCEIYRITLGQPQLTSITVDSKNLKIMFGF